MYKIGLEVRFIACCFGEESMRFENIIKRVNELQKEYEYQEEPSALKEKIIYAYYKQTLGELSQICKVNIDNNRLLLKSLENFLTTNWQLIKSTALCYTALPDSDITKLLCDLAEFVVAEKNKSSDAKIPCNIVTILMPTVSTDSCHNDYPDLDFKTGADIEKLLKTHILGAEGKYLIPVRWLTQLDIDATDEKIINPYFDYKYHEPEHVYLNADECRRLVGHSSLMRNIYDIKKHYKTSVSDTSNLLGHLKQFSSQLSLNSAFGIGQEANAGGGAYPAIINFMEYYKTLAADEKSKVPEGVREEIDKIFELASNSEVNTNATENLQTCIATRRSFLETAIMGNEIILSGIALTGESKENLIKEAKQQFNTSITLLSEAINKNTYSGSDSLSINRNLLTHLKVNIAISSLGDLQAFMDLSPVEIAELSQQDDLQQQIVHTISNIETLVILSIEISPEKLKALLTGIRKEIFKELIHTPRDISALFILLDIERLTVVFESFKDKLPDMIKTMDDLRFALQYLSVDQCTAVCKSLKDKLLDMIKTVDDFNLALRYLSAEQCAVVCKSLEEKLPDMIKTMDDLRRHVFQYFSSEQFKIQYLPAEKCAIVCKSLKDKLLDMIKTIDDLSLALRYFPAEQCAAVCKSLKSKLFDMIKSGENFSHLVKHLSVEQRTEVYEALKSKLPDMIKTNFGWCVVLQHLSVDQRTEVYEALKDKLPDMIKETYDLRMARGFLSVEQCDELRAMVSLKQDGGKVGAMISSWMTGLPLSKGRSENSEKIVKAVNSLNTPTTNGSYFRAKLEEAVYDEKSVLYKALKYRGDNCMRFFGGKTPSILQKAQEVAVGKGVTPSNES